MAESSVSHVSQGNALEGLRIIDLTMVWAGPFATQMLADMGAEVIKIESCVRPDMLRYSTPPQGERGERPFNRGGWFHMHNRNKYGITLDLSTDKGKAIFRRLVRVGDVVIENYSRRVMANFGFDYPSLREIKKDIILVSMPGYGATGPYRDYVAFGEVIEPMVGLSSITGYSDGPPMRSAIAYGDPITGFYAAFAALTAIIHCRRTGQGQYVDISHREGLARLAGEFIMDYTMNGHAATRDGNRDPSMAPHGIFPCKGEDRWVTIAVSSDDEWRALCQTMGRPELAADERFADCLGRLQHQDEVESEISAWTRNLDHYEVMNRLQAAGVAAGAVLSGDELFSDPHISARSYFQEVTHPEVGTYRHMGAAFKLSRTPAGIRTPAPTMGQHNEYILTNLLGMTQEEVIELEEAKVIGNAPLWERR